MLVSTHVRRVRSTPQRLPGMSGSMSKTRRAYETKFRLLLALLNPATIERGVATLVRHARRIAEQERIPESRALERVYRTLHERAQQILARHGLRAHPGLARWRGRLTPTEVQFLCDAGLGGLARWLRAAGYPAHWIANVSDDELIQRALKTGEVLLTTDTHILKRGVVRRGEVRALWIPPSLTKKEQLTYVLRELALPVQPARCMACGGPLSEVDKKKVRDQIPPRTYRWLDRFYRCTACGKLYWEGTHWQNIQQTLDQLPPGPSPLPQDPQGRS